MQATERQKELMKKCYLENKIQISIKRKLLRLMNPPTEEQKQEKNRKTRERYAKDPKKSMARTNKYRLDNPEWYEDYKKKQYQRNRVSDLERSKIRHREHGAEIGLRHKIHDQMHPEQVKIKVKKYRKKYPEREAARVKVKTEVQAGRLPKVSTLRCSACNWKQAKVYHHHLGYAPEHQLDVVPLCHPCHEIADRERND